MSEYKEIFDKEFLIRTRKIIEKSDTFEYSVTLLLNCTLSLVCLPIERSNEGYIRNRKLFNRLFNEISLKLDGLGVNIVESNTGTPSKQKLKCLRNGIAHIQMDSINENGEIVGVKIVGSTKFQRVSYECEFNFNVEQLKEFALFMVNKYLALQV